MKNRLVFITDCTDIAYNELRGTVLGVTNEQVELEPVVPVHPFSIINGNFILRLMADAYPEGTVFSVILNPSQQRPARLIGRTKKKNFLFLGANTGVFTWFLRDFGLEELYELNDPGFVSFGGKYVHAPAAAKIATGTDLKSLGKKFDESKILELKIETGTIVHIDNFGLMKFVGDLENFNDGDKLIININDRSVQGIFSKRMMSCNTGEWVIYPGSSLNLPELGKVREDGASELRAKLGDIIKFSKIA